MLDICRPTRHVAGIVVILLALVASAMADTPALTTISDTVYRADGTPAAGTLLISWPAFTTAAGTPVAAGSISVLIGSGGVVSVALVPNAAATPAGTLYSVVYRLSDGAVDCLNSSVWAKK
jgi:trimeric autotransporter adhesin